MGNLEHAADVEQFYLEKKNNNNILEGRKALCSSDYETSQETNEAEGQPGMSLGVFQISNLSKIVLWYVRHPF
jgi:hypothetical protein